MPQTAANRIRLKYENVKEKCSSNYKSITAGSAIRELAIMSLNFLNSECNQIALISRVPGKNYFSFQKDNIVARPANSEFFLTSTRQINNLWQRWIARNITPADFAKLTYTIALAPCLAMEIFDRQNKKGPATFFECLIGHLFAKTININPTKNVRLPVQGQNVRMTMDFLFDMGPQHRKIHMPVKMSSRERVVQAWAHQRLLNAAYGEQQYRGILVLFAETKLNSRTHEVVEICVPDQWLVYQSLLAKMDRIYYFDIPARYQTLTDLHPTLITIKQFGEFFNERDAVLLA